MRNNFYLVIIFCFFSPSLFSQDKELGIVLIEDLEQKRHPNDTAAVAAILYKKGVVSFGYDFNGPVLVTRVKTRIKIYKKDGYEWANNVVKYFSNGMVGENVEFFNAATYNLTNDEIIITKLLADAHLDTKLNAYQYQKSIIFPDIKEGTIIEYEYILTSPFIRDIRDWDFQATIPVDYSEYTTILPEALTYQIIKKGFEEIKIVSEKSVKFGGTEVRAMYTAENLPAIKDEIFVDNIQNYIAAISHEISGVKIPGKPDINFSTDWEAVTKTIYKNGGLADELKKTNYFEKDIDLIIKDKTNEEKIVAIFNHVQSTIAWDKNESYYCAEGVKKAYKKKIGNSAEINLMLIAMLRYAGINANPVILSTTENGIAIYPSIHAFNYVIAAIEVDDKKTLLDATEKLTTPNVLPERALNWYGRLIRKDGSSEDVNLTENISKETINIMVSIDPNGDLSGRCRRSNWDQNAYFFRLQALDSKEDPVDNLEHDYRIKNVDHYVIENEKETSKPLVQSFSFLDSNSIDKIGDKIYISPLLFFTLKANPFNQEKRQYPINFQYLKETKFIFILEFPEGYAIESIPSSINIKTENDIFMFKYSISNVANKIQINASSAIGVVNVKKELYPVLKDFFQKILEKQSEKIVLKKI